MKKILKNNWQIIILETLIITIFVMYYGKFGNLMVDTFREIYIPQQMLKGAVLYKDIFVIYPPLAYYINAFLMKIFGNSLNTLYFAGLFSTMGIIFFTQKIAEKFLNKLFSTSVCLFVITALVFSPSVFNSFLPYSFGITYGIFFVLISIFFCLNKRFPLSYLFYSLAILCKYEFVLLLPLLLFWSKKDNLKNNIIAFFTPILITASILFIQGVRIDHIQATTQVINNMSATQTLYWFYSVMGLVFRWQTIPIYIADFFKFIIPFNWNNYQEILIWSLPLIFAMGIIRFKHLKKEELFFIIATLLISAKVFFAVSLLSYGVYFLPLILISMFLVTPLKLRKILCTLFIIWSLIIAGLNSFQLKHKHFELKKIVEYTKNNTLETDTVTVFPECLAINVLANRPSDNKFYSLIPLYVETFGENVIIKRLEIKKPNYIIINNYDTSSYYYKEFGIDYAQNILKWIEKNYKLETIIEDNWNFKVYKINLPSP